MLLLLLAASCFILLYSFAPLTAIQHSMLSFNIQRNLPFQIAHNAWTNKESIYLYISSITANKLFGIWFFFLSLFFHIIYWKLLILLLLLLKCSKKNKIKYEKWHRPPPKKALTHQNDLVPAIAVWIIVLRWRLIAIIGKKIAQSSLPVAHTDLQLALIAIYLFFIFY